MKKENNRHQSADLDSRPIPQTKTEEPNEDSEQLHKPLEGSPTQEELEGLSVGDSSDRNGIGSSERPLSTKDIESLCLKGSASQELVTVEPSLIEIRKASQFKMSFCRTTDDSENWRRWLIIEDSEEKVFYLVAPHLRESLIGEPLLSETLLVPSITNDGRLFLWPVKVPGGLGTRTHTAHTSQLSCADRAKAVWVRPSYDYEKQAYKWVENPKLEAPKWPADLDYMEMIGRAFDGRIITSLDHELIERLGSTLQKHG